MTDVIPSVAPVTPTAPTTSPEAAKAPDAQAPQVTPPAPDKPEDMTSAKFAALARQERELQQKKAAYEAEYKAKLADIEAAKQFAEIKEKARTNPKLIYDTFGMTFDDLVQLELNTGKPPTADMIAKEAKTEVEKLKAELAEKERKLAEEKQQVEAQQQVQALNGYKTQLIEHIKKEADKYELVNLNDAHDVVWQRLLASIDASVAKHGDYRDALTYDTAAEAVEKDIQAAYDRTAKAKKLQPKVEAAPAPPAETPPEKKQFKVTPLAPTLTQTNTTPTPPATQPKLTDAQLKKKLAAELAKDWGPKKETLVEQYERLQAEKQKQA